MHVFINILQKSFPKNAGLGEKWDFELASETALKFILEHKVPIVFINLDDLPYLISLAMHGRWKHYKISLRYIKKDPWQLTEGRRLSKSCSKENLVKFFNISFVKPLWDANIDKIRDKVEQKLREEATNSPSAYRTVKFLIEELNLGLNI